MKKKISEKKNSALRAPKMDQFHRFLGSPIMSHFENRSQEARKMLEDGTIFYVFRQVIFEDNLQKNFSLIGSCLV